MDKRLYFARTDSRREIRRHTVNYILKFLHKKYTQPSCLVMPKRSPPRSGILESNGIESNRIESSTLIESKYLI